MAARFMFEFNVTPMTKAEYEENQLQKARRCRPTADSSPAKDAGSE
jgi:hypothetical protein